jgi:hypothetical protein
LIADGNRQGDGAASFFPPDAPRALSASSIFALHSKGLESQSCSWNRLKALDKVREVVMPFGDPQECRKRALYCAKRAVECGSPLAQEKFFNLAKTWMRLAIELEQQCALLDQWGDRPTEKEPKGALKDA